MEVFNQNTNPEITGDKSELDSKTKLSDRLSKIVELIDVGLGRSIVTVTDNEIFDALAEKGLGPDSRISAEETETVKSVFEGLEFDKEKLRSQIFAILDKDKPIGVMTFLIAPKPHILKERYFAREKEGLRVSDVTAVTKGEIPEFYIIPGWTEVLDEYRGNLTIAKAGIKAFDQVMRLLTSEAPSGTWTEAVAQGKLHEKIAGESPEERKKRIIAFREATNKKVGTLISYSEIPINMGFFGVNSQGSKATVSAATRLGLTKIENLASDISLGPVFTKKVKQQ